MFSYDPSSLTCAYAPNLALKSSPFSSVVNTTVEGLPVDAGAAVFVLQCDVASENVLHNADLGRGTQLKNKDDGSYVRG